MAGTTKLPSAFRSNEHDDMNDFTPLPGGDYVAQVIKSEMKEAKKSKNRSHMFLELIFEILQGEHKGKKVWVRLNLINPSVQAVEIANKELGTIARAAFGHDVVIEDSQQVHGKPMVISVKFVPATASNPAGNEIGFYKQMGAPATADPFKEGDGEEATADDGTGGSDSDAPEQLSKPTQDTKPTPWKK